MTNPNNSAGWPTALPSASDDAGECEVGYKKPPKHTRWPKGKSGNPKGPKKKGGSVLDRVQAMLNRRVTTTGGESMTLSDAIMQFALQGLVGKGARSAKASIDLIDFLQRFDVEVDYSPTLADEGRLGLLLSRLQTKDANHENQQG